MSGFLDIPDARVDVRLFGHPCRADPGSGLLREPRRTFEGAAGAMGCVRGERQAYERPCVRHQSSISTEAWSGSCTSRLTSCSAVLEAGQSPPSSTRLSGSAPDGSDQRFFAWCWTVAPICRDERMDANGRALRLLSKASEVSVLRTGVR